MRPGALPTVNLLERSHEVKQVPARHPLTIVNKNLPVTRKDCYKMDCYKNFTELCERTKKLKLPEWQQEHIQGKVVPKQFVSPLLV